MRGLALLAVGIALAFAACGDDESDSGDSFVADADAICTEVAENELAAYRESGAEAITVAYLRATQAERAAAIERLRALEPPEEDAAAFDEYLVALERSVDNVGEAIAAVRDRQAEELTQARRESREIRLEANGIGAGIGFAACAGVLSDEAAEAITETLELSADPNAASQLCRERVTDAFIDGRFESVEDCVEQQAVDAGVESVEVEELQGVDGVSANVLVTLTGGGEANEYEASLAYEDDVWKLNSIGPLAAAG